MKEIEFYKFELKRPRLTSTGFIFLKGEKNK